MTNVVPPAIARLSSPCLCKSSTASRSERGWSKSNERIVIELPWVVDVFILPKCHNQALEVTHFLIMTRTHKREALVDSRR
jgi:hypothetical protein